MCVLSSCSGFFFVLVIVFVLSFIDLWLFSLMYEKHHNVLGGEGEKNKQKKQHYFIISLEIK